MRAERRAAVEALAKELLRTERWRYGQAVFNAAYELYPAAANLARGSAVDCFNNNERVPAFLDSL